MGERDVETMTERDALDPDRGQQEMGNGRDGKPEARPYARIFNWTVERGILDRR